MKSLMRLNPFGMVGKGDPFAEIRSMQKEMDNLFGRLLGSDRGGDVELWSPRIESYVKDGKLHVRAELPGIDAKDLDVSIVERDLVIKGERKEEKDEKEKDFSYREISYGAFERHFMLPEGVKTEELKAKFINGILELTVPVPEMPKAKRIPVETKDGKQIEAATSVKKAA